jgi:hypothetical protein
MSIHFKGRKGIHIGNDMKKDWLAIFGKRNSLQTKDILDVFLTLGYDIYVMPKEKQNPSQLKLPLCDTQKTRATT